MASPNKPSSKTDMQTLVDLTTSSRALLTQFITSLSSDNSSSTNIPANPPNPLQVLRDSAKLLKAHVTKLSLLLLNKPFTPSALCNILREVTNVCLPAMMSAVEICSADIWGALIHHEVVARVRAVMREMEVCVAEVADTAQAEDKSTGRRPSEGKSRDSLASTGVVWEACDAVIELESLDVGGLAIKRAEVYRDMIKDAIEELKEWGEDVDDDDEEDDIASDEDDVEDMFAAANKMPKDQPELRQLLDDSVGKLKKINMLYTAITKRRLKTFGPAAARQVVHVKTMDELVDRLKQLPEMVDELANSFYELDEDEAKTQLTAMITEAEEAIRLVKLSWEGKEDEFTAWSTKWTEVIK